MEAIIDTLDKLLGLPQQVPISCVFHTWWRIDADPILPTWSTLPFPPCPPVRFLRLRPIPALELGSSVCVVNLQVSWDSWSYGKCL